MSGKDQVAFSPPARRLRQGQRRNDQEPAFVGGFTLLSRSPDIVLAAVPGGGLLERRFLSSPWLPNYFARFSARALFNAAFVPSYSRVLETEGASEAKAFSGRIRAASGPRRSCYSIPAWSFTPFFVDLLAPGFRSDPAKFGTWGGADAHHLPLPKVRQHW